MLTYRAVKQLFPSTRGIADDTIQFHYVFVDPYQRVEKGLFIPLMDGKEELKLAIEHGAIAALWKEGMDLPHYIPNYFPVFFVPSPIEALTTIVQTYMQTNRVENSEMTKFYLTIDVAHHIEQNRSYDIAVINELKQLQQTWFGAQGKEGCERSW
jgi:hypothetical protein